MLVDCEWNDWQAWSDCSATCGDGTKMKNRSKSVVENSSGTCSGSPTETANCNMQECAGRP